MALRWFNPDKIAGELCAGLAGGWHRSPNDPTKSFLAANFATAEKTITGLWIKHGGLAGQVCQWRGMGVVVGYLGQVGSGMFTPWFMYPVAEEHRPRVEALLAMDHVKEMIAAGAPD